MSAAEAMSVRPRIPHEARRYSSKLDATHGALRTTSDGNLVDEDTGDWLLIDTPPHDQEDREMTMQIDKKIAKGPAISLPEAKNGATGLNNPRTRKPFMRLLRNKILGSDRPAQEFEDPAVLAKRILRSEILARQDEKEGIDMRILEKTRMCYDKEMSERLGTDWFEHALVKHDFWLQVQDAVLKVDVE